MGHAGSDGVAGAWLDAHVVRRVGEEEVDRRAIPQPVEVGLGARVIDRITETVDNHDLAPDPESINWGTVGSMEKTRGDLQALRDWLFGDGECAA